MLFKYEPVTFDEIFSPSSQVEWTFPDLFAQLSLFDRTKNYPFVNVVEDNNGVQVLAEIPGVPKEDVKLQLHDGTLTISGERKSPEKAENRVVLRQEIHYGTFSRTVQLPESIDTEKISAEYANGVLKVTLPKREAAKPQEISIR
ncbi:MAG TPA: Hsp20/alpha crystallin family protein [Bacteroidota bacterium]|nr:Hsp20/alpha crystallin family protein [Bacteroidota bacterium]